MTFHFGRVVVFSYVNDIQVGAAWPICRLFNCSIGFHSGSGESYTCSCCHYSQPLIFVMSQLLIMIQENLLKIMPLVDPSLIATSKSKPAGVTRERLMLPSAPS